MTKNLIELQKEFGVSEGAAKWCEHLADVETWTRYPTTESQNQSRTYHRAAKVIRIKTKTGIALCVGCHKIELEKWVTCHVLRLVRESMGDDWI